MPVFFFVDPEIMDDPKMDNVKDITLHYSFFKTGGNELLSYNIASSAFHSFQRQQRLIMSPTQILIYQNMKVNKATKN